MSVVSRLIVVQSDARVAEGLRYAFEQRDAEVQVAPADETLDRVRQILAPSASPVDVEEDTQPGYVGPQLVVAGSEAGATGLVTGLRRIMREVGADLPILFLGNGASGQAALAAGATAALPPPAFLRDVVTLAQLVIGRKHDPGTFRGELEHFDGVFYVLRAVNALKESAVLTLVRGLRRGEVRIHAGEVTSAQVGALHGLAALHHLLLWRSANFELRLEDVVRRQQIPMTPDELMEDARRFLAEVDEAADSLDLAGVYEPDTAALRRRTVPDPILRVLRTMDGTRTVPDVVEDSPYLTFDTLRMVNRLVATGLVRRVAAPSKSFSFQFARGLNSDSLFGNDPPAQEQTSAPSDQDDASEELEPIDWSDVLPTSTHADDALAQVVPAAVAAGEIMVARERAGRPDATRRPEEPAEPGKEPHEEREEREKDEPVRSTAHESASGPARASHEPMSRPSQADDREERAARTHDAEPRGDGPRDGKAGGFTADEEAFFREGASLADQSPPPAETFDDLDQGYKPLTFWQRLFGGKRRRRVRDEPGTAATGQRRSAGQTNRAEQSARTAAQAERAAAARAGTEPADAAPARAGTEPADAAAARAGTEPADATPARAGTEPDRRARSQGGPRGNTHKKRKKRR